MVAGFSTVQRVRSGSVLASRHTAPATTGDATLVPAHQEATLLLYLPVEIYM
jgi:hypothetical protein